VFFKIYAIALPVFFALDMVWLGLVAKNFYRDQIGFLMKSEINWTAGIGFYLLFNAGLVWRYACRFGLNRNLLHRTSNRPSNIATLALATAIAS
jgi:uncharacterized membrane protein